MLSIGASSGASSTLTPRVVSGFQYGINTDLTYNCQDSSVFVRWAQTQFGQDKALGANSIGIVFPLYVDSITSNQVYAKSVCGDPAHQSPPVNIVASVADVAHALGLRVFLRPYIDSTNLTFANPDDWAGTLRPSNTAAWFNNYVLTLSPYLLMAQQHHIESFAIASELNSLAHSSLWARTIVSIKSLYHGQCVYTFSWNNKHGKVVFPGVGIGMDAYPGLSAAPNYASVPELQAKWTNLLYHSPKYYFPLATSAVLDEVGISAVDNAYATPWTPFAVSKNHPFDPNIQARWFSAACGFAKQNRLRGIYYWGPWLGNRGGSLLTVSNPATPMDIQPAAQLAISRCFK